MKPWLVLLGLALTACPGPRSPEQEQARQSCLDDAADTSDKAADRLCHGPGHGWTNCPHREEIMAELGRAQKRCR